MLKPYSSGKVINRNARERPEKHKHRNFVLDGYCSYRRRPVFNLSFQTSRQNLYVRHASFFFAPCS